MLISISRRPTIDVRHDSTTAQAAANQDDYSIFDTMLVQGVLQFKWQSYAAKIFNTEFSVFIVHLAVVCVFSCVRHSATAAARCTLSFVRSFFLFRRRSLLAQEKLSETEGPDFSPAQPSEDVSFSHAGSS